MRLHTLNGDLNEAWTRHCIDHRDTGFYTHLRRLVQHVVWLKLGHEDEDLVQDTVLHISRVLDTFKGTSLFSTWVFTIAVNACLYKGRHTKKDYPLEVAENLASDSTENIDADIEIQKLFNLISDKIDQSIFIQKFLGYSNVDIARRVGLHKRQVIRRWIALCEKLREKTNATKV